MDNIIYIILAAAVFIAMAGVLLFIGTDALENVFSDSEEIRTEDPSGWVDINSNSFEYEEKKVSGIQITNTEAISYG